MFIFYGRRTARIKRYPLSQQVCGNCGTYALELSVYRQYAHIFFIPFFPFGAKRVEVRCRHCRATQPVDPLDHGYIQEAKTPLRFWSLLIIIGVLILLIFILARGAKKETAAFVASLQVGDVYTVASDQDGTKGYYFLRIADINGDTVAAYHSDHIYNRFVTRMGADDYFVRDVPVKLTKYELREMLDRNEIRSVDRRYGQYKHFDDIH